MPSRLALGVRTRVPDLFDAARRVRRRGVALRLAAVVAVLVGAFVFGYVRQIPAPSALAAQPAPPGEGDPRIALFDAAAHFEARLSVNGGGLSFTATQIQLLRPEPGGPELLLQPDRDHPDREPTAVDQILLGSRQMSIDLPGQIFSNARLQELLEQTPRLSQSQIDEFLRLVGGSTL